MFRVIGQILQAIKNVCLDGQGSFEQINIINNIINISLVNIEWIVIIILV